MLRLVGIPNGAPASLRRTKADEQSVSVHQGKLDCSLDEGEIGDVHSGG